MDRKANLNSVVFFVLFWVAGENLITIRSFRTLLTNLKRQLWAQWKGGK